MSKLYFKYGCMGSSKTLDLIRTAYNYRERGMEVLVLTSNVDNRSGVGVIKSRTGAEISAQSVDDYDNIVAIVEQHMKNQPISAVLIDEVQFFTPAQVDQMLLSVYRYKIPVIAYGLRTDFRTHVFPASRRLFEIAHEISELKTVCWCGKKATVNARLSNGRVVYTGQQIQVGGNESYVPLCHFHWLEGNIDGRSGLTKK